MQHMSLWMIQMLRAACPKKKVPSRPRSSTYCLQKTGCAMASWVALGIRNWQMAALEIANIRDPLMFSQGGFLRPPCDLAATSHRFLLCVS